MSPEEIRRMWQQWYALPSWARQGITAALCTLVACAIFAGGAVAAMIGGALFGDVGVAVAIAAGLAVFVGAIIGGISYLDPDDTTARARRERRTGEKA